MPCWFLLCVLSTYSSSAATASSPSFSCSLWPYFYKTIPNLLQSFDACKLLNISHNGLKYFLGYYAYFQDQNGLIKLFNNEARIDLSGNALQSLTARVLEHRHLKPLENLLRSNPDAFSTVAALVIQVNTAGAAALPHIPDYSPFLQKVRLLSVISSLTGNTTKANGFETYGANGLEFLEVSNTPSWMQTVPSELLGGLDALRTLLWDGGYFSSVPPNAFASVPNLRKMDFSDHELHTILPGAFNGLSKLEHLRLQNEDEAGHLTLNASTFRGCENITKLELSKNIVLSNGTLEALTQLEDFDPSFRL